MRVLCGGGREACVVLCVEEGALRMAHARLIDVLLSDEAHQ